MKKSFVGKITLDTIDENIAYWQEMCDLWKRCEINLDDDLNLCVFKLYFRLQNVEEVRKELKRIGKSDFSISKEITLILEKGCIPDKLLEARVKEIQKGNHGYSMRRS